MARKTRLEYAGAAYHVLNRGNHRRDLFAGTGAARAFANCLAEAAGRFGWRVHAFVVMRNHFHMALDTPEPNLSDGMKWLQGTWARLPQSDRADARLEIVGADREAHREIRAAIWEDKLQLAAAALHLSLANLPAAKSAANKVQLAALLKKTTSVSNLWLARRLHMGQASSISQFVGRFRRAGGTETGEFKSALSRVAT